MSQKRKRSSDEMVRVVLVPKEVFNADSVFLIEWLVDDGSSVEQGTNLCEIETSKSTVAVESEQAGYLRQAAQAGAEIAVGGILGYVTEERDTLIPSSDSPPVATDPSGPRISAKARSMIERLGLDESLFGGRALIREQDVLEFVKNNTGGTEIDTDPRGASQVRPLSAIQRRVAILMERSIASIPASYLERTIDLQPVRLKAAAVSEKSGNMVTVLDVLVSAASQACLIYPQFNGFLDSRHYFRWFESVHVALAVEVERDLFVVVVQDAARKDIGTIAKELRSLQYKALRRRLSPNEMAGGTLTITSLLGHDMHRFQPLLYPDQTAIIGICDSEAGPNCAQLILGFDHRVANGGEAAEFLSEIYTRMCATELLDLAD